MTNGELFAQLLTEAIYRIRTLESKSVSIVQDELGYALGKKGGASIEYWRKGFTPSKTKDVELLIIDLLKRSDFDHSWAKKFLLAAKYPQVDRLLQKLFQVEGKNDQLRKSKKSEPTEPEEQPAFHNNLPPPLTPFVGRHIELEQILDHLKDDDCRLITITGGGGIGKSRLAIEAVLQLAQEKQKFEDGILLVNGVNIKSEEGFISTIADALSFKFFSTEGRLEQLLSYLRDKNLLLFIDNLENLTAAVSIISHILTASFELNILVTSRQRLNLRGEWVLEILGMDYPQKGRTGFLNVDEDIVSKYSAVQLFIQNARRIQVDFNPVGKELQSVARICRMVEGIPLAIELASTWIRTLSCEEIGREIENNYEFLATNWHDMPERHRSLQAVFDYSWGLLSEVEKETILKLSVFHAGFQREAASEVAGASLMHLSSFVDKSFLLRKSVIYHGLNIARYEMHRLLRKYVQEKLIDQKEVQKESSHKHCRYFARFLREREAGLKGGRQTETLVEIGEDLENILVGWEWAVSHRLEQEINDYIHGLYAFYDIRSWIEEGEQLFHSAIERLEMN